MTDKTSLVMFCCNNPDNGAFTGFVETIHISENVNNEPIEFEGPDLRFSHFVGKDGARVRVGTNKSDWIQFPISNYRQWTGNWCWDSVVMLQQSAVSLMVYLKEHGWHCTCAPDELYDAFNGKGASKCP